MLLLPFENFTCIAKLNSKEVVDKVETIIRSESNSTAHYSGQVSDSKFELIRIIWFRNSFRPIIKGKIKQLQNQTEINITMRMHPFVEVILSLGFLLVLIYTISNLVTQQSLRHLEINDLYPFLFAMLFIFIAIFAFKYESLNSKKILYELFASQ